MNVFVNVLSISLCVLILFADNLRNWSSVCFLIVLIDIMAFKVCVLLGGFALLCSFADASMQCFQFRDKDNSFINDVKHLAHLDSCPFILKPDDEFCCYDWDLRPYCCDAGSVILNWSVIAVVILIIFMLLSTLVSCICCLCCPCCCLYKRRRGIWIRNQVI